MDRCAGIKLPSGVPVLLGGLMMLAFQAIPLCPDARAASSSDPLPDSSRVRVIRIISLPVFPETTGTPLPWYYRLANHLHRDTRPSVIRREILFREGIPYDPLRSSESERLLRGRGIFESVRITSSRNDTGTVTTIRTQDLWTLGIDAIVEKQANTSTLTIGIRDANILGSGNAVRWGHTFSSDRNSSIVSVSVPRVGVSRASAGLAYAQSEDAISRSAAFSRPIETYFDRWTWDLAAFDVRGEQRFYRAGIETGSSPVTRESAVVSVGHYTGLRRQAGYGGGWIMERTSPRGRPRSFDPALPPPAAIDFHRMNGPLLFAGVSQRRFLSSKNLARYGIVEDVPLGWVASLAVAANTNTPRDPTRAFEIRPVVNGATILGRPEWALGAEGTGFVAIRRSGTAGERIVQGTVTARWQPSPKALSVAQVGVHAAAGQPRSDIFYLGTGTGLRGYPTRAIGAKEYVLGTIEQRFWSGIEVLWVGLGGNVFADLARPMTTDGSNDASWRLGIGGGVLLGLRKSAQAPLRIEVAWRRDRAGARPTLSVSSDTPLRLIPDVALPTLFRDLHSGLR